ncbi:MAG: hypothetical protein AAGA56_05795 [Myxococcota bacterium]
MMRRGESVAAVAFTVATLVAWPSSAQEGSRVGAGTVGRAGAPREPDVRNRPRPRIMLEPGDVVDVVDAFDDGDDFDLAVSLQFQYSAKRARILRESAAFQPGLTTGGFTSRLQNVAQYTENTTRLVPRLDIGLYKDLALYARFPFILENRRRLSGIDGTENNQAGALGGAIDPTTNTREQLFTLPFESPNRSGLEYIATGLDFGIFNQARDDTKPTWILGLEGRFANFNPMHACNDAAPRCFDPGDINQDGVAQTDDFESIKSADDSGAGVTRGTFGLEVHSLVAKRIKYIEPYGGFRALFEFQAPGSDFGQTDFQGALVNRPPIVGTVLVGMMVHPWEDRENFGRLSFDFRFEGEYHSEGRDYSELFDALGSSPANSLRQPRWSRFQDACPGQACDPKSVIDQGSERSYFSGLSVVEAYGSYRGSTSVTWRASEYIKLNFGGAIRFDQPHGITHDQACNPDFTGDVGASGPCRNDLGNNTFQATGVPNPAFRRSINEVGRRFYVDTSTTFEVFFTANFMF